MKKKILVIGIIIVIICTITIYFITTNKSNNANENNSATKLENNIIYENNSTINNAVSNLNNNNPKEIISLLEIPTPDSIIFYHNGVKKTFVRGSNEFNEIIKLNNKRDNKKLGAMELCVDIDGLLQSTDMLEYAYKNYKPVYFNLIKDEQLEKDNKLLNWVSVGYDSKIFKQFIYSGVLSADDLINYLYSL